ncbi:MAG: hypothetical protein AAFR56_21905, partial [Chloroflexota bacterium]
TAPLYTVLLAAGYTVGIPFRLWTHGMGALALWGIAVCGARLADRAAPKLRYAGLIAGLFLVAEWHLIWAAAAGMETALFAMWVLVLPLLIWREHDDNRSRDTVPTLLRGGLFGAVSALAILTRPEGIVLAGLCGLAWLIQSLRVSRRPTGSPLPVKYLLLWVGGAAVGFAIFIAPYLWLNLSLTGGLLPNTSAAKQMQFAPRQVFSLPRRLWQMTVPPFVGGQVLLVPGMVWFVVIAVRRNRLEVAFVPIVWAFALIALYAVRLPFWEQHGRYVIPAVPGIVLTGAVGMLWLLESARRSLVGRVLTRVAAIGAGAVFAVVALVLSPGIYARDVAIIDQEMVTSAQWIDENVPDDVFMAIHDIGAVAYYTPRPILDIAGLVSPEVIPIVNDADALWALMQAEGAQLLMALPDQIPGDDPADPRLCEVFNTGGTAAINAGGANMAIYALAWDENCSSTRFFEHE